MTDQTDDDPASRAIFARRLRAVRRAYGASLGDPRLTAVDFARRLEISQQRYGRYERGEIEPPFAILSAIRHLTGVSLDALIAGELPGDGHMIPLDGLADDDASLTLADRLRWTREIREADVREVAEVMRVKLRTWRGWEAGATRPPVEKMREFAHRFGVTLGWLYDGQIDDRFQPEMRAALTALLHPPGGRKSDSNSTTRRSPTETRSGTILRRVGAL
jgi:transcriptional regulator with XRE-family HTH domain